MNVRIEESWRERLQPEFDAPYFEQLTDFVRHEYATTRVYPPGRRCLPPLRLVRLTR